MRINKKRRGMDYLNEIISKIQNPTQANKTFLIAIDGFGGSGKSTLANH